jgi:hypothetical protein
MPAIPHRGVLTMYETTPADANAFSWTWRRGALTTKADFGDPRTTDAYELCVYDGTASLVMHATAPAGASCPSGSSADQSVSRPCWKETTRGFRYVDKARAPLWLQKVVLERGLASGTARIVVKGKGAAFAAPSLPLAQPLTVQLKNSSGLCWEATYAGPATKNTAGPPGRFRDTAD